MSLVIIAKMIDDTAALRDVMKNPGEKRLGENSGAIIPAANHATAKLVKNSENIFPIN